MRTADDIAGLYLGGDAARSDLRNHILEYGEAMALAAVLAEREACAKIADRRWDERNVGQTACAVSIAAEIRSRNFQNNQ